MLRNDKSAEPPEPIGRDLRRGGHTAKEPDSDMTRLIAAAALLMILAGCASTQAGRHDFSGAFAGASAGASH